MIMFNRKRKYCLEIQRLQTQVEVMSHTIQNSNKKCIKFREYFNSLSGSGRGG